MRIMLLSLMLFVSCAKFSDSKKQNENLSQLFEQYWEEHSRLFPLEATSQGDNRFNHLLPNDQTEEFRMKLKSHYGDYLQRLLRFNRSELSENDRVSFDVFKYEMEMQLEGLKFDYWKIPFQQFWGLPLTLGQLGSGESYQPFLSVKDYENWLQRMESFEAWANSSVENFRRGIKSGIILPKVLVKKMIPQMKEMVVSDPEKSLFFGPVKKMPPLFSAKDKEILTAKYKTSINEKIVPAFKKLAHFLENEYLPQARASHGISSLKNGKNYYQYLVKYWTTTQKSPEEIYQTGLREVSRIRSEMERVKAEVKFKGNLKEFFSHLRTYPKLMPYEKPQEVLDAFGAIQEKIRPHLKSMFGRTPKTPFEIRQTEEFRAASASAEYQPGSPDGKRPGIFYIPILDAKKFNVTSGMESLFLHEAIPGHHYQISLQQENDQLPKFRRFSWYGAYGEGWALYTESLGKELGLYMDPYQYMGALGDEMHRALRLVVDVGIHLKGWSREKAIRYMMDNEPIPEQAAVAEVERYMAIPGQALSYKIGSLKIWELRQKYQSKLGQNFSLSQFHDEYLKDGCLPLAVVESKLDSWSNL
jgi:uncharacterized protein (DUF885 family)